MLKIFLIVLAVIAVGIIGVLAFAATKARRLHRAALSRHQGAAGHDTIRQLSDWRLHGKEAEAKIFEKIRTRCQKRNASLQAGHGQERSGWERRQGQEPQAGAIGLSKARKKGKKVPKKKS